MNRFFVPFILLAAILSVARAQAQPVQGDVRSIGFEAGGVAGFVAREGQWTPILVELTAQGQVFQGQLRCEVRDLDGDRVSYAETPVTVTPGAGIKRVWCYVACTGDDIGQPKTIEVISDAGERITSIDVPIAEIVIADIEVVLDISERAVPRLLTLNRSSNDFFNLPRGDTEYYRGICVASLPARNLPDRWFGLEAADVVIWDDPDPDTLSSAQLEALMQWVRNGGKLVIGLGASWPRVAGSRLLSILPFAGQGRVEEVDTLVALEQFTAGSKTEFTDPVAVVAAEPADDTLILRKDRLPSGAPLNLIAMRQVGSGRVIACATRLGDISTVALPTEFLPEILDLNPRSATFRKEEADYLGGAQMLYGKIIEPIEFRRAAGMFAILAAAFVALYILVSTVISWGWLRRKDWTQASWTLFAGLAVMASALSLVTVSLMRGVGDRVASFSFIDLETGANDARGRVYLGYKSSRRQRVDLALNCADGPLRPLTARSDDLPYATPDRYQANVAARRLLNVPTRATLKQFEGFWRGRLDGSVAAQLTVDRKTGRITPQSWVRNNLGARITGGYLLYIDPRLSDLQGGTPRRVAGLTKRSDRREYLGHPSVPPACNVLIAEIPRLNDGEQATSLNASHYKDVDERYAAWSKRNNPPPAGEPMLKTLWEIQNSSWISALSPISGVFSSLTGTQAAAFMASTRDLYLQNVYSGRDFDSVGTPISTRWLPDVDVTHWLTGGAQQGTAVLLLFSDEPGPASLVKNGREEAMSVGAGMTIYRVRVPIKYTGFAPGLMPPGGNG